MRFRWWRATVLTAVAALALVYFAGLARLGEAEADQLHPVPALPAAPAEELVAMRADAPVTGDDPATVLNTALADPALAAALVAAEPTADSGELGAALAALRDADGDLDPVEVNAFFEHLGEEATAWLAVLYPSVVAEMPGAPFDARITANRLVLEATTAASTAYDSPDRPWTDDAERPAREELASLIGADRDFLYLDPYNNNGDGSWIEVVGDLDTAEKVAILVPGGSAVLSSENFQLYYNRAKSFVDASEGELAVVVWAAASWPSGWIEESWASWSQVAAESLAAFTFDLRNQIGPDTPLTLAGHSYGGAVIGYAETYDVAADQVLHIASAGMGNDVYSPEDYTEPCRPRYSITGPGDPISYVQGMPYVPLLGHGADPDDFPGNRNLATGRLSDAPDAVDDYGISLAEQGIAGKPVEGVHSHSEIFYPESDAWNNILKVLLHQTPEFADEQPEAYDAC
ncbi:alpha/beta hydrolase family protein [Glycomyces sp. TRM65418]|uniref:alpha/beta hydrolase n=1 Tax=Glycomyces sp. TRM65418 TaxID=2867006 RepID=UPI001CE56808|nr:alpha/beta hydrolase [Glycomyces sp. TRM65418]MCC3762019.1 alpha/beta hydrolase family protein [Glycomyces sp. TRM65418]QZD56092.1 alpha/beta hydrolase family protein [Glycomyces sp. TRM65418]